MEIWDGRNEIRMRVESRKRRDEVGAEGRGKGGTRAMRRVRKEGERWGKVNNGRA